MKPDVGTAILLCVTVVPVAAAGLTIIFSILIDNLFKEKKESSQSFRRNDD